MAEIYTSYFGGSTSPRVRLVYNITNQTGGAATITWILDYVPTSGYAASTNGQGRSWTIAIDGQTRSGSFNINGISGATRISTGTITVNKQGSARNISLSASFGFNITWSGTYAGTLTTTGTLKIDAKQSSTVSYNANGGSGAPGSQTKWYGDILTLSTTRPTRSGYNFLGWATSSTGSVAYQPGGKYGDDKNVTLYAIWSADSYSISYNANGGSGAPSTQTKTHGVNLTLSSTKPTRTNYNFLGWGVSPSSTTVSYSSGALYTANASITLYAIWSIAYNPPRIANLKMDRCGSDGSLKDDGTYIRVTCDWTTDKTATTMYIRYKRSDTSSWSTSTYTLSGTSGSVNQVVGSGSIDVEYIYNAQIEIKDSSGSTIANQDISTMKYIIDFKSGGTGIAIGKVATEDNMLDIAFNIKGNGGMPIGYYAYQQVKDNDINNALTAGIYNFNSSTKNQPNGIASWGYLEVIVTPYSPTHNNSNNWIWQRYYSTFGHAYERYKVNSDAWTPWKQMIFSSNFDKLYKESLKANSPIYKGEINFSNGLTARAYKIGYMITLNIARQFHTWNQQDEYYEPPESYSFPSWAKPMSQTTFQVSRTSGSGVVTWPLLIHLNSAGSFYVSSYGTGYHCFYGSVTYMCSNAD